MKTINWSTIWNAARNSKVQSSKMGN